MSFEKIEGTLDAFVAALDKFQDEYYAKHLPESHARGMGRKHELMRGPKYIRVVQKDVPECQRSAYCFLDGEGNIYKPAGWKAPARGIRGNILRDPNYSIGKGLGPHGAARLR